MPSRVGEQRVFFLEWIDEFERKESRDRNEEQRKYTRQAIDAAQESAVVLEKSAESSQKAARWTMIAAIASASGVVLSLLVALGWIGNPAPPQL